MTREIGYDLGKGVSEGRTFDPVHPLLREASSIVNGPRQRDYGKPEDNHRRTAVLFNAYLNARKVFHPVKDSVQLDAEDVCILNILQKISRHAHSRKHDNLLDIVGWATNAHIVGDYTDVPGS